MTEELKPCPFCSGTDLDVDENYERDLSTISCNADGCSCSCGPWLGADEARKTWNTRPIEDALRAELTRKDELIKRLEDLVEAMEKSNRADRLFRELRYEYPRGGLSVQKAAAMAIEADESVADARARLAEVPTKPPLPSASPGRMNE